MPEKMHETTLFTRIAIEAYEQEIITEEQLLALDGIRQAIKKEQPQTAYTPDFVVRRTL